MMATALHRMGLPAAAVLLAVSATAGAQAPALEDPTRPPPEARLVLPAGADTPAVASGPQLQSVLIGNHGRQVAVIDGQTLRIGDKIGGATLVKVARDRVELQRGRSRQVLKLAAPASAAVPAPAVVPAANPPRE